MLTRRLFADRVGDEIALKLAAQAELDKLGSELPSTQALVDLTRNAHPNLASSVLYGSLIQNPVHGSFIRTVNQAPARALPIISAPSLVIVPGMFYREYPEIGADGKLIADIAARFGIETSIVPTASLGAISENLEVLHQHLSAMANRTANKPFWLVSMSRGSAEVKWLLQTYPHASYLSQLRGWISVCGILSGTPLHERIYASRFLAALHRGVARINRVSPALAAEMVSSNSNWRATVLPAHVQMVNIIAVPLSWHITKDAVRRYRRLCPLGPTDGVVLLADYLREPGLIYPIWGVDHFMRTARISALFYRLLYHLLLDKGESDEELNSGSSNGFTSQRERNGTGAARG